MPGDPRECREHARRCAELAKVATTPEAREQFLSLQMSWIRLAADLDNAKAFIELRFKQRVASGPCSFED
jgi:hypothetical protein